MEENKLQYFKRVAPELFKNLIIDYGYSLNEVKVMDWSIHLIYINDKLNLELDISQSPYGSDYGFSIFITNLKNKEDNILYNTPHEKQDKDGVFLTKAHQELFSDAEMINLIKGIYWKKLNHIYFKK